MGQPAKPHFLKEGPATACVYHGQLLGWKICTSLSFAMGMYKSTLGRVNLSGCAVREQIEPGDWVGGSTIEQNAKVAEAHGVHVDIHTGSNVAQPKYVATHCQAGRGFSLAGNTSAIGKGNVNHNIWVNQVRGGTIGAPTGAYVYDPWSGGPVWWTWAKVMAFAHALHPWGESDPRTLKSMGVSGVYCGIFPDTEPHVHLTFSATRTTPFPDRTRVKSPAVGRKVNVRTGPGTDYPRVPTTPTLPDGTLWVAFQVRGPWYGNHNGDQWIHNSGLTNEGGPS